MSSGEIIVFFDADVVAPPGTLRALIEPLIDDLSLDAVFGSYDQEPKHRQFVSQYRNLFHHYIHQISNEEASTFWAGCGAVRKSSFEKVGGFDLSIYQTPMIEDIELGHRMRAAGMRIRLEKGVQVKHLKRWTAIGVFRSDIFHRGIPWMRLLLSERGHPSEIGDLNLKLAAMLSIPLVWSGLFMILLSLWYPVLLPASLLALGLCVLLNFRTYAFFNRIRGFRFALMAVPMNLLYHCCNGVSALGGIFCHIMFDRRQGSSRPLERGTPQESAPGAAIQVIEYTKELDTSVLSKAPDGIQGP
jgi:hypothetical protein